MDREDFKRQILDPMGSVIADLDVRRVEVAYEDAKRVDELMVYLQNLGGGLQEVYSLFSNGKEDDAWAAIQRGNYVWTLHKALIEFANVFMTILMHEAHGRKDKECTVGALVEMPIASAMDRDSLHCAYCLYMYRNKVIAHHEVPRGNSLSLDADGTQRLVPMPKQFQISPNDYQELIRLDAQHSSALMTPPILKNLLEMYSSVDPAIRNTNAYMLLDTLYYGIPAPSGAKPSQERRLINRIVERGGCKSMSPLEILETIDCFARELAKIAPF